VFEYLQIYDPRERLLVGAVDSALHAVRAITGPPKRSTGTAPRRVLLLRLERIGDLLMSLDAIADAVDATAGAKIDLVIGSWNAALVPAIRGLSSVETLDASWLAREGGGLGLPRLLAGARSWRARRYDLAINLEPDIRSNLLVAVSGAAVKAGFLTGGGGPLLDIALRYDPRVKTSENQRRLVAAALGRTGRRPQRGAVLELPADARRRAGELLRGAGTPLVGLHASGGRAVKQWDPQRFAEVASRLVQEHGATVVLTGTAADRPIVEVVRRALPAAATIDLTGIADLLGLAAVMERLDVYITGDTGPMHLAAAVGTPVVAIFGPSDPARYAPSHPMHRVVRIDLPCAPCNRIRRPPARCTGVTPDCLRGVGVDAVHHAATAALAAGRPTAAAPRSSAG
jgi:ADP-heptose:LPS heptosyltransferase